MKEKILSALKASIVVGGKTSLSDKTLNTYVDLISAQITEESQITEAIKPHVVVLKEIQGNINSVAAESATAKETALKAEYEQKIKDLEKANPKSDDKTVLTKADLDNYFATKMEDAIKPYKEKIEILEKEKASGDKQAALAAVTKELGLTEEDMKFIIVPEGKDAKEYLTGYKQSLIDRGLKPASDGNMKTSDAQAQKEVASEWLKAMTVGELETK